MVDEHLTVPGPMGVDFRCRKSSRGVCSSDVLGRIADLDDLEIAGALEHSMPNPRWLCHAVAGREFEWLSLIFVDDSDGPSTAEDQLKGDFVEVHVVGNRTGSGNANLGCDDCSTLTIGDEVAVEHAGPSGVPRVVFVAERGGTDERRKDHRRGCVGVLDAQTLGTADRALSQQSRVGRLEPQNHRLRGTDLQVDPAAGSGEGAARR